MKYEEIIISIKVPKWLGIQMYIMKNLIKMQLKHLHKWTKYTVKEKFKPLYKNLDS